MIVHIVGRGEGWEDAPPISNSYEVWGLNTVIIKRPLDVGIDVHQDLDGNNHKRVTTLADIAEIVKTVNYTKIKFYTHHKWEHVQCIPYPLKEIMEHFGTDYFGGGFDYCIALALFQGATKIEIWGFNFLGGFDYIMQLPSASYWVGRAHEILKPQNIVIHGRKNLILRTKNEKMYGFDIDQCQNLS